MTIDLGHNQELETGVITDDLEGMELSGILSEAGEGSAAAGGKIVLGTRTTSSSFVHSTAGANEEKEKDDGDNRTDPESGGVHFDPANPYSLLGQEGELGEEGDGDSTKSEAKDAGLEQQLSSVASEEIVRDGAMVLSE